MSVNVAVPDERLDKLALNRQIRAGATHPPDLRRYCRPGARRLRAARGSATSSLPNIREVDAIAHVVRCFEDGDVTHVDGKIDPIADIETIETELMLADLDSLEKRATALEKKVKGGDKEGKLSLDLMNRALVLLREGKPARLVEVADDEEKAFRMLGLLSAKPVLYVCNVEEESADQGNAFSQKVMDHAQAEGAQAVVVSAKIESEIAVMPEEERRDYLEAVGLSEPGLNRVIRAGYRLLGLVTYFTVGPKGSPRLDHHRRHPCAAGRRRDPYRFREGLHPRRDYRL